MKNKKGRKIERNKICVENKSMLTVIQGARCSPGERDGGVNKPSSLRDEMCPCVHTRQETHAHLQLTGLRCHSLPSTVAKETKGPVCPRNAQIREDERHPAFWKGQSPPCHLQTPSNQNQNLAVSKQSVDLKLSPPTPIPTHTHILQTHTQTPQL